MIYIKTHKAYLKYFDYIPLTKGFPHAYFKLRGPGKISITVQVQLAEALDHNYCKFRKKYQTFSIFLLGYLEWVEVWLRLRCCCGCHRCCCFCCCFQCYCCSCCHRDIPDNFFVLVLLSALVKRFSVFLRRDFSNQERKKNMIMHTKKN